MGGAGEKRNFGGHGPRNKLEKAENGLAKRTYKG